MTFMFSTAALLAAIFVGLALFAVYLLRRDYRRSVALEFVTGPAAPESPYTAEEIRRHTHQSDVDNGLHGMEIPVATVPTKKHKPCPCGDDDGVHCTLDGCPYPPAVKKQSARKPHAKKPIPAGKKPAAKASAAKPKPKPRATDKKPVTKSTKKKAAKK